jgi:hypothetical protein
MTEADWNSCTDPQRMLGFLRKSDKASERKLLLFACACCRVVWHLLGVRQYRKVVLVAERYADRQATQQAVEKARRDAYYPSQKQWSPAMSAALQATVFLSAPSAGRVAACVEEALAREQAEVEEQIEHTPLHALLRDIFNNPFRPATLAPAVLTWNDGAVVRLVQGISEELAFDRLPILADALEESGCASPDILAHCRGPGPHVRGCWVVDLLSGKN